MKNIHILVFVIGIIACHPTKQPSNCHYVKTCQDEYILECPNAMSNIMSYQDSITWGYLPDTNTYFVFGDTLLKFEDYLIKKEELDRSLDSLHKSWDKD
jgi:hypothetical protein